MTVCSVPRSSPADVDLAARFASEVQPLFDPLHRRARGLTRCDADAEDLFQDTLLHAFAGFGTFREGSNLKAWLFRILYNRWVSIHRVKQRRPKEVSVDDVAERDLARRTARLPVALLSAESEVLDAFPDNEIKAALVTLPDGFREAIYYSDIQGYTCAEIASLLNIPHGTVMSRVSRGRRRLRITLAPGAHRRGDVA